MQEGIIWKDIIGYEGYYKISNTGEVLSVERTVIQKNGYIRTFPSKKAKPRLNVYGYTIVLLSKEQKTEHALLHRLLAIHFIENPENLPIVRHLNDNKLDFRLENLAWGTKKDNADDRVLNGFNQDGGNNKTARLVLNTQTGIFYDCLKDAVNSSNFSYHSLHRRLIGKVQNNTPFIYA